MSFLLSRITPESLMYRWLLYWRWIPRAGIIVVLMWIASMSLDRAPPFKLLSAWASQPRPGGVLVVRAKVWRDLDRECSVTFSRYLFDRFNSRHEVFGPQVMTPQGLRDMDAEAPGELNIQVPVPLAFPAGPAKLTTILEYRCNALQDLVRPIPFEMHIPFEVLP